MKRRRSIRMLALGLAAAGLVSLSVAAAQIVHEYFEPTAEDIELRATVPGTDLPSVLQTRSGVVAAPEPQSSTTSRPFERTYGSAAVSDAGEARYQVDRDTTRPDVVSYDDPFTPSIPPFKRLYAYDAVNQALELVVRDQDPTPIDVGGRPQPQDDQFYASLLVDSSTAAPVRIPSVGPGSRPLVATADPETEFSLWRDSADNWFLKSNQGGRFRLTLHLAIDRSVFGSEFGHPSWADLVPHLPPVPENVRQAAYEVSERIGVEGAASPNQVMQKLVAHFRDFAPSEQRPDSTGVDLYQDIALSRKGVCRHRAYAFVVTALGLGLPARFIRNEAHAWVEVYDATLWHRIDLGGAAGSMQLDVDGRPAHVAPRDPYKWPPNSEQSTGQSMASQALGSNPAASGSSNPSLRGADAGAPMQFAPLPPANRANPPTSRAPVSTVQMSVAESVTKRGARLPVSGDVRADGELCPQLRVDVALENERGRRTPLGTLMTDAEGHFSGRMVIPYKLSVGEYDVVVSTPGDGESCGPGSSVGDSE